MYEDGIGLLLVTQNTIGNNIYIAEINQKNLTEAKLGIMFINPFHPQTKTQKNQNIQKAELFKYVDNNFIRDDRTNDKDLSLTCHSNQSGSNITFTCKCS